MSPLEQAVRKAIAFHQSGALEEAKLAYEAVLKQFPRDPNALMNLSTLHLQQGRRDEAARMLKRLIEFHPKLAYPYFGYGNVMMDQGRFAEAITSFEKNLTLQPGHANAHWNLAVCYLLQGNYAEGLPHFEWRFQSDLLKLHAREFAQPQWRGEPLDGKTLLIYHEQGFGDFIQCARYFSLAAAKGAKLLIETPPALMRLMQANFPDYQLVSTGSALPSFDAQCPVMSLPLALSLTLETIPQVESYLTAPSESLQHWQTKLGPKTQRRIGLVWAGAPLHAKDKLRSIPLEMLQPLLQQNIELHALQKDLQPGDETRLHGMQFHGTELRDFADTAALIMQLDLVITVDTATAHLAAALGKPTWILLHQPPDYRWMLSRADSPLYPTVRLFRQGTQGDWAGVVQSVIEAL